MKDATRLQYFVDLRTDTGKRGYNPALEAHKQTFKDVRFPTYVKEMFLDSDTKVAVLSGAPSDLPQDWMLSNDAIREACDRVNSFAGSRRMLGHFIFTPGQGGWLDAIDRGIELLKPAGWKGYTIGDNTHKEISRYPWLMDDEQVTYKGYEKFDKAGIRIVAVHKGLFPPSDEAAFPRLTRYAKVDDAGKAATDWPQLNFIIYHSGYRYTGDNNPALAAKQFEETGRMDWVSDLAEVPAKYGVSNVYADVGASFAAICLSHSRGAAAMMGILMKGLGADHVLWGTDSLWFGSPQWQIEALRRMEILEDMQQTAGFAPLGALTNQ
ncbi:MAG: amidohydrolase family protein [Acetobacteraceae bacterium]|nr:amidohydrolase family protein [Acetobacteraceae bacterium]